MDKKQKKNSQKSAKPTKKSQPVVDEKPKRLDSKAPKQSYDLPAVQCKDTLLLDYDYSKQYSKRNLVSNWDKYADLPDDDDDNGQLSAADFEQLLSASKSIGDHFTFAAERSWLQNDGGNASDEGSVAADLFKLNISNLKNGIGRLPFYMRQGLPKEMFTDDEITSMNYRANYFENENSHKLSAGNEINQNLLNILTKENVKDTSSTNEKRKTDYSSKKIVNAPSKKVEVKTPTQKDIPQSSREAELIDQLTEIKLTPTVTTIPSKSNPINTPSSSTKVKSNKTEDIQDWLDDILNEN
ncbi:uncharacterized protein LOC129568497 [Sitodiplosis mosellana]|uniref:uncharacterized protein LOC129568497 n=1 Tax=Sitodiplosis mosellana TaxID=263140 RepID=UPI0024444FCA|nr:uncharacterized protein LOC129568497 [Sitodiplosis mosellana]